MCVDKRNKEIKDKIIFIYVNLCKYLCVYVYRWLLWGYGLEGSKDGFVLYAWQRSIAF